jgi:hypothetical protein
MRTTVRLDDDLYRQVKVKDVNILVFAHRTDTERHEAFRDWLDEARTGGELLGVSDLVLSRLPVRGATTFLTPSSLPWRLKPVQRGSRPIEDSPGSQGSDGRIRSTERANPIHLTRYGPMANRLGVRAGRCPPSEVPEP